MKSAKRLRNEILGSIVFFTISTMVPIAHAAPPPLLGVQLMASGRYHICAVVNGGAQCWGQNLYGQLGNATTVLASTPVMVSGLNSGVTGIAAGYQHSCAIVNGGAQCWGANSSGELGLGTMSYISELPQAVVTLASGVSAIATGTDFTCAIANGAPKCWGDNSFGQLGNSTTTSSDAPVAVTGLSSSVTAISAGALHSCAIVNGGAQCWGDNSAGELGNGSTTSSALPVAVTGLGSGVTSLAAGAYFSCAVVNGAAKCWGENAEGSLGDNTGISSSNPVTVLGLGSSVVSIAVGDGHACAVVNNDAAHPVKCWGQNASGQLGNNSTTAAFAPVDVSFAPPLTAGDSVNAIVAGGAHTCARAIIHGITLMQCWGDNQYGELGLAGPPAQNPLPATVTGLSSGVTAISTGSTALHNCAVVSAGVQCWGSNGAGELGSVVAGSNIPLPIIAAGSGVTAVAAGFYHSCVIINGVANCFGANGDGELGDGTTTPRITPMPISNIGTGVSAIAAGGGYIFDENGHSCAIVGGAASCWGENSDGQLGNNSTTNSNIPVAVAGLGSGVSAIAVGGGLTSVRYSSSCAVVNAGAQCWGNNVYGQLGNGSPSSSSTPVAVSGLTSAVTAITVGNSHACAIANNGVKCWGDNEYGQLGNGTQTNSATPVAVTGLSSGVTAIAAGANHTCAIVNGGEYCWGDNTEGQLGDGLFAPSTTTPVAVTGLGSGVIAIAAGYTQSCALLTGGAEKCWGSDQYGQLGVHRFLTALLPQSVIAGDEIFRNGFDAN